MCWHTTTKWGLRAKQSAPSWGCLCLTFYLKCSPPSYLINRMPSGILKFETPSKPSSSLSLLLIWFITFLLRCLVVLLLSIYTHHELSSVSSFGVSRTRKDTSAIHQSPKDTTLRWMLHSLDLSHSILIHRFRGSQTQWTDPQYCLSFPPTPYTRPSDPPHVPRSLNLN